MGIINNFFGMILNLIFEGVSSFLPVGTLGVTIIIFTLVAQLLLTPLKLKQQRTTRAMGRVQPELQKIQKKYANKKDKDSQLKQSEEMSALYKKHKISPFSGCLPLLIQMPIIFALFNVLRNPTTHIAKLGYVYHDIAQIIITKVANYQSLLSDAFAKVTQNGMIAYDLTSVTNTQQGQGLAQFLGHVNTEQWQQFLTSIPADVQTSLTTLLQQKHEYEWFLVNLVDTPAQLVSKGLYLAILVPIIAGASTFIFSKITMAASTAMQQSSDGPNQTESMMKAMNIMMPIMTGTFAYTMPCGLALYWISGNIIMMVQQMWVNKVVEKEEAIIAEKLQKEREAAAQAPKKKKRKKVVPVQGLSEDGTSQTLNQNKGETAQGESTSKDQSTKNSNKEDE